MHNENLIIENSLPTLIVIDGSNIVQYRWKNGKKVAFAKNLKRIRRYLNKIKCEYPSVDFLILVDYSLPYIIDQRDWLEKQIEFGKIFRCPREIEADCFIIKLYMENPDNVWVISKDLFQDYSRINEIISQMPKFKLEYYRNEIFIPSLERDLKNKYTQVSERVILPIKLPKYLEGIF